MMNTLLKQLIYANSIQMGRQQSEGIVLELKKTRCLVFWDQTVQENLRHYLF